MSLIIGIDLGTSNSAVAWVDPRDGERAVIHDLPIPQLVRPGEQASRPLLPSTLYVPAEHERALPDYAPPLALSKPLVVGELARWKGARVPGRVISSAKSWLCHPGVDRQAPILPWGAPADVERLSPVEASALLLEHLRRAWQAAHSNASWAEQEIVITVPASFDEAARALTVSAARRAGFERFTLLEEPQAAFYDFAARHRAQLAKALEGTRLVLVVDVGGGTTDFTLVEVQAHPEGVAMQRIAVGDHLLLGGDNMDAALAHRVQQRLGDRARLSAAQWTQLVQVARGAKEQLLSSGAPERVGVALASEGSRLLGGTISSELTQQDIREAVIDGFFPRTSAEERPQRTTKGALQEMGLPYAQDAAITRHLAQFLAAHAEAGNKALGDRARGALPRPDAILLNGGVFNSAQLADALVEAVSAWWPEAPRIRLLAHDSLDLAVARGAAYYGLVRRGLGRRIGGGTARAFYVRVDSGEGPAAVCLIPRGFEEGQSIALRDRTFSLTLGRPVQFELLSTSADRVDKPGEVVRLEGDELKPLPPTITVLKSATGKQGVAQVELHATLTEIGTLELSCVAPESNERWRLEFELRGAQQRRRATVTESMPARFSEATEHIQRVFGHKPLPVGASDVKQLWKALERTLGPRESWSLPVLRELWGAVFAGAAKRRRSADHEKLFFQLCGYCLRPGFGYPLDEWRGEQLAGLFPQLVTHHQDKAVWNEFWIMWRRAAGALPEEAQRKIWEYCAPHLERRLGVAGTKTKEKLKGIQPEGWEEMVRAVASFEHLEASEKLRLGRWIADYLATAKPTGGPWAWALGRIGARVPIYGSMHHVIDPEAAGRWGTALMEAGLERIDGASFALVQLVRRTGDLASDVDDSLRGRALNELRRVRAPPAWVSILAEAYGLGRDDEARAIGDTLPPGLALA